MSDVNAFDPFLLAPAGLSRRPPVRRQCAISFIFAKHFLWPDYASPPSVLSEMSITSSSYYITNKIEL